MKAHENYDRVLQNSVRTDEEITRLREEASSTKSLYVVLQNQVQSLLDIVDKLQRNQGLQ